MKKIGKYKIIKQLGCGGMGTVYEALDPVMERNVAIKIILEEALAVPEIKKRFYREARSVGKLNHNNITTIYDVAEDKGKPYIVMEYLDGRDLSSFIEGKEPFTINQIFDYSRQICLGLKYAHSKNIIHRDIKPSNIRILEDGKVKIIDFGLAKPEQISMTQAEGAYVTKTGLMVGTPWYMSPEQIQGGTVDKRTDIFSFGVLLYEMVTNKKPFEGNYTNALYKIVHKNPNKIVSHDSILIKELEAVILKCLEKSPENRYNDFSEVIEHLDEITQKARTKKSVNKLLAAGKKNLNNNNFEYAISTFKEVLENDPTHSEARDLLEKSKSLQRQAELVADLLSQTKQHIQSNNISDAVTAFKQVLGIDPTNKIAFKGLKKIEKRIGGQSTMISSLPSFSDTQANNKVNRALLTIVILSILALGIIAIVKLNPGKSSSESSTGQMAELAPVDSGLLASEEFANSDTLNETAGSDTLATQQAAGTTEEKDIRGSQPVTGLPKSKPELSDNKTQIVPAPAFGKLQITSQPSGSTLWLDEKIVGTTPYKNNRIKTGSYTIKFSKKSYNPTTRIVQIQPGEVSKLHANLIGLGRVVITSQPDEALVYLGNQFKGKTPIEFDSIEEGMYQLAIRKNNFRESIQEINVKAGKTEFVQTRLVQQTGSLTIQAIPWGSIYIDGILIKTDSTVQYSSSLTSGVHTIKVVHTTFGRWEKKINILTDQQQKIVVDFNKTFQLTVTSEPLAGEIFVDGKSTGKYSPHLLQVKTGLRKIEVRKSGFGGDSKTVLVDKDITEPLFFKLKK